MSYRVAPPPPQPPSRVSVALLANLAGLLLVLGAVVGLVFLAFRWDESVGWAAVCVLAGVAGWRLLSTDEA